MDLRVNSDGGISLPASQAPTLRNNREGWGTPFKDDGYFRTGYLRR
jgi:hypothetical protein